MIEIKEMVIRTTLGNDKSAGESPSPATGPAAIDEKTIEMIVEVCMEKVRQLMNDEKEP